MTPPSDICIRRACEHPALVRAGGGELDAIFFSSSATQSFASEAERAAFRERWLGRYLDNWPERFWIATAEGDGIVGYLAGSLIDPAASPLFEDHAYLQAFRHLTRLYPAHLHINVDESWRRAGLGARLITAFCDDARREGSPGVHVVTASGARNVPFYLRNGFAEVGTTDWNGRNLVMLGRPLGSS